MPGIERKHLVNASRWGVAGPRLPDRFALLLRERFPEAAAWPAREGEIADRPPQLDHGFLAALDRLGDGIAVRTDIAARAAVALGQGGEDLVRLRVGDLPAVPEAVLQPADHAHVVTILDLAARAGVKVVPRGGGTSVTGAVNVPAGAVVLDLAARMNRVQAAEPGTGLVRAQAGILGPALEAAARAMGRTVGHFPQSFERSTLGGWIAARSAGQYSSRYGRAEDLVVGLRAATPAGELRIEAHPASAVGPEPLALLAGCEGAFGVITEATVRTLIRHETPYASAWLLPGFDVGLAVTRRLSDDGLVPSALRLSDEVETERLLAAAHVGSLVRGGLDWLRSRRPRCLLLAIAEGSDGELRQVARRVRTATLAVGGLPLGSGPARQWLKTRFSQPELRDALLDIGIVADTMETSVSWQGAASLTEAVRRAVADLQITVEVGAHVSHVYPSGCCLYFTMLSAPRPSEAWASVVAVREAVARAFLSQGCPLSHHHGTGRYLAHLVADQIGPVALDALRAVKTTLDPQGILNPGLALDSRRDADRG
jgi:alkyldihydroxyacetonephosphate synthase